MRRTAIGHAGMRRWRRTACAAPLKIANSLLRPHRTKPRSLTRPQPIGRRWVVNRLCIRLPTGRETITHLPVSGIVRCQCDGNIRFKNVKLRGVERVRTHAIPYARAIKLPRRGQTVETAPEVEQSAAASRAMLIPGPAPLLTVIVPVFNEAATIDDLLRLVQQAPYDKQIVVVDDGSTDGTSAILANWVSRSAIEVYRHPRNRGKGRAIRTALRHARGQFTIVQDGDLETDPCDYPFLIEPLICEFADVVVGSRFRHRDNAAIAFQSVFRLGVQLLNVAVRMIYGVRLSDEACCYKALPTEMLRAMELQCEGFEFCPEFVAKSSRMGLRIHEVGVRYSPRDGKSGKKIRYRDGLIALWWLWKLRNWKPSTSASRRQGDPISSPSIESDVLRFPEPFERTRETLDGTKTEPKTGGSRRLEAA